MKELDDYEPAKRAVEVKGRNLLKKGNRVVVACYGSDGTLYLSVLGTVRSAGKDAAGNLAVRLSNAIVSDMYKEKYTLTLSGQVPGDSRRSYSVSIACPRDIFRLTRKALKEIGREIKECNRSIGGLYRKIYEYEACIEDYEAAREAILAMDSRDGE